ncbi:methyltransferase domain-containing protein [Streptomyces rugosispiralis]|uniref:Protein-L-isoaspartate O-methyltransferase n=1 Tax=Streptomyces rugosispiralis TaxID=2967341 RepID=A0ABT1V4F3_9ACTN|nr:methyltransferase domain-containing protein [Streptomyces rugosispiralis]MCQ8192172.1 methyltransferase domain-containing protein [Streptomyces rugosispiralis]
MPVTDPWTDAARALADKVTANAAEWHEAVSVTPRHLLVPQWWERIPNSPAEEWELVAHTEDAPARVATAYSDATLVTRVGPRHADHAKPDEKATGSPTSSSTLPGLVVSMMHRLDAKPGHKVLDVGTGSGYALALFAHRLGDDHVTSVDVDAYLVEAARARLAAFGRTPRIEATDATRALPDSEYDRIMATVSVRPVPETWLHALRPGGRIVTTIAHTALLITADMGDDGVARGSVQPDPATFMETRQEADYPPKLNDVFTLAREGDGEQVRAAVGPIPDLWQEWPLRWLYELDTPGVETRAVKMPDGRRVLWLLAADGSWACAEESEDGAADLVHQGGSRRLWDGLERVRRMWEERNRFSLHSMTVELNPDSGGTLTAPDGTWTFTL